MVRIIVRLTAFAVLFSLVLAGCVSPPALGGPAPVQPSPGFSVQAVDVAVDDTGGTNLVFTEDDPLSGVSHLVYVYLRNGIEKNRVIYSSSIPGDVFADPQIAVTTDNDPSTLDTAFIVLNYTTEGQTYASWTYLLPDSTGADLIFDSLNEDVLPENTVNPVYPRVAANGDTVYAVYYAMTELVSGTVTLFYRQLGPTLQPSVEVTDATAPAANPDDLLQFSTFSVPDVEVSDAGTVHIAAIVQSYLNNFNNLYYISNAGGTPLVDTYNSTAGFFFTGQPAVVVDSNLDSSMAFTTSDNFLVLEQYSGDGQTYVGEIPYLGDATGWTVSGPLDGAAVGTLHTFVFSASNPDIGPTGLDVYMATEIDVTNIDESPGDQSPPRIASFQEADVNPFMLVGWRNMVGTTLFEDVFSFTMTGSMQEAEYHTVFNSPVGTPIGSYELDGMGEFVAGAWVDIDPDNPDRQIPWVAFNAWGTYIPQVGK